MSIKVKINPILEFILMIVYLSEINESRFIVTENNEFNERINNNFSHLKDHPLVLKMPEMWDKNFCWLGMVHTVMFLNEDFKFPDYKDYLSLFTENYEISLEETLDYISELKTLYDQSGFEAFIKQEYQVYKPLIDDLEKVLNERPLIQILDNYLGVTTKPFNIILSLFRRGFMSLETRSIIVCQLSRFLLEMAQQRNEFDRSIFNGVWHELSHPIINPLTDEHFEDNNIDFEVQYYCDINESIIWGITNRLSLLNGLITENDLPIVYENGKRNRAPKSQETTELLALYESDDKFKNIRDFYPELIKLF